MTGSTSFWILIGVAAAVLVASLLFAGGGPAAEPAAVPAAPSVPREAAPARPPIVDAGPDVVVGERARVPLNGTVSDPSGPVSVRWSAEGNLGSFENAQSARTAYIAPSSCDCETVIRLTLTATNADGLSASDRLSVSVRDPLRCPTERSSASGTFIWSEADPCAAEPGDPCPAVPSTACDGPCVTWAPSPACTEIPVPCPCASGCDDRAATPGGWPFSSSPAAHPRDRATPRISRHYPASMREGDWVRIRGDVSNPACLPVCFVWTADKGRFENADSLEPIYHAPSTDLRDGEAATLRLTIYDGSGGTAYDQIRIRIVNTDYRGPSR